MQSNENTLEKKEYLSKFGGAQLTAQEKLILRNKRILEAEPYREALSNRVSFWDRIRLYFSPEIQVAIPNSPEAGMTDMAGNPIHIFKKDRKGKIYYYGPMAAIYYG